MFPINNFVDHEQVLNCGCFTSIEFSASLRAFSSYNLSSALMTPLFASSTAWNMREK